MHDTEWNALSPVLEPRAVSRRIAEARPYVRYDRGDLETVYADGRWAAVSASQRQAVFDRAAKKCGGLIITKHPVPGVTIPVLPQMRPDDPVRAHLTPRGRQGHEHAAYGETARAAHVKGSAHLGEETDAPHSHADDGLAKYLLTPKPYVDRTQTHTHDGNTSDAHIYYQHRDDPPRRRGQHPEEMWETVAEIEHEHERHEKDPRDSKEKRLDMNPLSRPLLEDAGRVFFSIEGSIKADALVSRGECSFAVPSVTMWSAPELDAFAREYLAGRYVYVVPDADWASNPMVASQAFLCADYLKQRGAIAAVAASPGPEKGIDDFLAAGGQVGEMRVIDRRMSPGFEAWSDAVLPDRSIGEIRARERLVDVVRLLAMLSTDDGRVVRPGRSLCQYVGFGAGRLQPVLDYVAENEWDEHPPFTASGFFEIDARWWDEVPVYTVREDLRPCQTERTLDP